MLLKKIIFILIILIIIFIAISYFSEKNFIAKTLSHNKSNSKIIYSYGLFSKDPMTKKMISNTVSNSLTTGMDYEVLGYKEVMKDIDEIPLPGLKMIYESIPRGASKADFARLVHLYVRGGHYADLDVRFNKTPVISDDTVILYTENYAIMPRVANFAISAPPRHVFIFKVLMETIRRIKQKIQEKENDWSDQDVLQTTGPDVITDVYRSWNSGYVKRIGLINSRSILRHEADGSWRQGKD